MLSDSTLPTLIRASASRQRHPGAQRLLRQGMAARAIHTRLAVAVLRGLVGPCLRQERRGLTEIVIAAAQEVAVAAQRLRPALTDDPAAMAD